MNEAEIKACPFCGKPPTIKQAGRTNYWWVGCEIHLGPESSGCGVSHSDYIREEAIRKWNERAGDREPVMSKTPEPSTLASATGSEASSKYPAFGNMEVWTRVRATKDITEKNRIMRAGETGKVVCRWAYAVAVRPDGKKLTIQTGDESALEVIKGEPPNAGADAPATDDKRTL